MSGHKTEQEEGSAAPEVKLAVAKEEEGTAGTATATGHQAADQESKGEDGAAVIAQKVSVDETAEKVKDEEGVPAVSNVVVKDIAGHVTKLEEETRLEQESAAAEVKTVDAKEEVAEQKGKGGDGAVEKKVGADKLAKEEAKGD